MSSLKQIVESIYLNGGLGPKVRRATAADPQNVWQTIFTVAGGPVFITFLVGVRTIIQAGGASLMQFRHSVGPTAIDAGTLAVTGDAVGTLYYLTGDPADAILSGAAGVPVPTGKVIGVAAQYQGIGLLVAVGNIQVTMTAAAGTGSTRYVLGYIPVDDGTVVAA